MWSGLLTGPIVWLMLLEFNYVSAYVACESRATWFMHAAVLIGVAMVALAGMLAWRARYGEFYDHDPATDPLATETRTLRSNWMSISGVAISAWFIVVILAMEVPILVLKECQ